MVGNTMVCTALTVNDWITGVAAAYDIPPIVAAFAVAVMVQVPNVSMVTTPAFVTVQTPVVDDVYRTVAPTFEDADMLYVPVPIVLSAGALNVMI